MEIERTEVRMIVLLRYLDFNLICYFSWRFGLQVEFESEVCYCV